MNKWLYEFLAMNLARLRTPGVFEKLHNVAPTDMPRVLNAIIKMERRFAKKAQGAETPLSEMGQNLRAELTFDLWAALLARPRHLTTQGETDDGESDNNRRVA